MSQWVVDRRRQAVDWARGFGFIRLAIIAVLVIFLLWLAYTVFHRLFVAPGEQKQAEATVVVAKAQGEAEEAITTETLDTMREREIVRTDVREKVSRGRGKVNAEARKPAPAGRSTDDAVHSAGVSALCELHDSLCGDAGSAPVQPIY